MSSIYELAEDLHALEEFTEEEQDDIDLDALADTFEGLQGAFQDKCDAYGCLIKNISSDIAGITSEIDRLTKKKRAMENRVDRLKKVLAEKMQETGETKFQAKHFSFWIATTDRVQLDGEIKDIPAEYIKPQPPKIDLAAIKKHLKEIQKEGQIEEYAHLEENKGVRFR